MNRKLILLLFCTASVVMGCDISDTCVDCTVNCFWVKFAINAYCLQEPVYEVHQGVVVSPGEMALCAEFGAVETTTGSKSENTTNQKMSNSSSSIVSIVVVLFMVTALVALLFVVCNILWIIRINGRQRDCRRMCPSVTYANDVNEVSVRLDI